MKTIMMTTALALVALGGRGNAYQGESADREQARRDQLRIAVQEICPVSGQKLGKMGPPVKVTVGQAKEVVFLCCQGCMKGKINPRHWATIHMNFAKAQGICPVMKNELPKDAKWTIAKGQIVYVCCPPCIEKIQAEPDRYLRLVDDYYAAYLKAKKNTR